METLKRMNNVLTHAQWSSLWERKDGLDHVCVYGSVHTYVCVMCAHVYAHSCFASNILVHEHM